MKTLFLKVLFISLIGSANASEAKPLRIALSGAFISESGSDIYQKMADYITAKTGQPIMIVTGLSYDTINKMLEDGALAGGFVCGLPYVLLKEKKEKIELMVAPVMKAARYQNKPIYYSDLVVAKDSPYKTLEDLRGKKFVYNDELSNSGYNLPRAYFLENKVDKKFFGKITRSGSHEESISAVANKKADFSFVDSLVLDYENHIHSKDAQAVRVIHSLGPAGVPPLIMTTKLDKSLFKKIKQAFVNMHKDPEGRKILNTGLVERFDSVNDSDFNSIRDKYLYAKSRNSLEIGK